MSQWSDDYSRVRRHASPDDWSAASREALVLVAIFAAVLIVGAAALVGGSMIV